MGQRMSQAAMGARVRFCNHDGYFVADIWRVGNCNVIRASGPVSPANIERPAKGATHLMRDYPTAGFWKPDLGVFVVPEQQVTEIAALPESPTAQRQHKAKQKAHHESHP